MYYNILVYNLLAPGNDSITGHRTLLNVRARSRPLDETGGSHRFFQAIQETSGNAWHGHRLRLLNPQFSPVGIPESVAFADVWAVLLRE